MSDNPVKWTAAGLTPEGNALQAALLGTGDGLTFTRAAAADVEGVERLDLTLQSPCTVDGPKCRVPVLLTNVGVETGFVMTELRFYVRRVTDGAPTGEEVLYATVTDETGDPIPTAAQSPGFTIDWAFVFQYGNASEVMVTLDPVGLVSIGMVGQPNGVAGLDKNGAVPIPQGGTGATTVQGVVDAFGIFLAISAAAAYDPEGSYAVGDYCTHGGKLHKCSTPIESGEEWNAAHWTATTVANELTNKLNTPTSLNANVDLNDVKTPGFYYCDGATGANRPINTGAFSLLVEKTGSYGGNGRKQTFTAYNSGVTCMRTISGYSGEAWQGWKTLSTATPPQVRNLTLQSGFSANGDCTFFVTQESAVFLAGGVSGTLPANQDTQIGTLPSDACPSKQRRRPAVTNAGPAYIDIHTDGTVRAHPFAAASQCWFDCSFVAGGGS
nr:pyocin knob domain-containing protein [uncultured Agathobaculum sp.]